jgi:hypothetical protein
VRFAICTRLVSAFVNPSSLPDLHAGPEKFEEASSYIARYELYDDAFVLYANDKDKLPVIQDLYGNYLYDRREFSEAAIGMCCLSHVVATAAAHTYSVHARIQNP